MYKIKNPTTFSLLYLFLILTLFACSKDTDLLASYVLEDAEVSIQQYVVDDEYEISVTANSESETIEVSVSDGVDNIVDDMYEINTNANVELDVLSNDSFENLKNIELISTTQPDHGSVKITSDNTLEFTTSSFSESELTFQYTVQFELPDGTIDTGDGTVTISINQRDYDLGELKAFPGAEGFGRHTTGGRGGAIVEVTNLNDSGTGSLRKALSMTFPRTIVFRVGGTIECQSYLEIPSNAGNVTIAGQTAPGDGIQIKNGELRIQASNVIVRYLKIRLGHDVTDTNEDAVRIIAYNGNHTSNVIIDHCSVYWGKDENFEIGGIGTGSRVSNVTVQNTIVAENIASYYGVLLWNRATEISFYQNILAHNKDRNISSTTCDNSFEMVNNILYGFKRGIQPTYENQFDVVGNVLLTNPDTNIINEALRLQVNENNCPDGNIELTRAYVNDNILDGGQMTISSLDINNLLPYIEQSSVMNSGINASPANSIVNQVLGTVGASLKRDQVDARLINEVNTLSGSYNNNADNARNFPQLANGTPYLDSDKDGMSNQWELANGLNPDDPNDAKEDANDDGYTNLEAFLHSLTFN